MHLVVLGGPAAVGVGFAFRGDVDDRAASLPACGVDLAVADPELAPALMREVLGTLGALLKVDDLVCAGVSGDQAAELVAEVGAEMGRERVELGSLGAHGDVFMPPRCHEPGTE